MTFVLIDDRGRCTIPGVPAGPYDSEIDADGVVRLVPLVRATDKRPPTLGPTAAAPTIRSTNVAKSPARRRFHGRDWTRIPAGTVIYAPKPIGKTTMGPDGKSPAGTSMNQYLLDHGISRNAWDCITLQNGLTLAQAYDAGEWS